MPVILGIDPGSRITGFGVIEAAKQPRYVASGCIRVKDGTLDERLKQIYDGICEVVRQYQPEQAAIEQIFMARNADSALKLGQARGVAIVACAGHGLPVAEYSARQVKQAVVGKGGADKSQVQHMVTAMLKLSATPQADAADALAVALCHAHTSQSLIHVQGASKIARGRLR